MIDALLHHKILVFIGGFVVIGLFWLTFSGSGASNDTSLLSTQSAVSGPDKELVETLLALRAVRLDGAIFSESAFVALRDFSTAIVQEPVGRSNPFAPFVGAVAPVSQTASPFSKAVGH